MSGLTWEQAVRAGKVKLPPDQSIVEAMRKAGEGDWWRLAAWQPDQQSFYLPSRSTPGEYYVLVVRPGSTRECPWWWRLRCNCPAETSGKYLVCWHKYACSLAFKRHRGASGRDLRTGKERAEAALA